MKRLEKSVFLFVIAAIFFPPYVLAETVEVEATIKSVDAAANQIVVGYETKAWQKTIQLVVGPKAAIVVDGKPSTLDALKVGQKVVVSFDKELLTASKIEVKETRTRKADPSKTVYRMTLQLSEFGDGKFRIEKTSELPKDDFEGTSFKLSRWPKTKATKGKDGVYRLIHDFSDADDLDLLAANGKNSGRVIATPGVKGFQMRNGAGFFYAKRLRLPITVTCDIVNQGGEQCGFHLYCQKLGELDSKFWTTEPKLDSLFNVSSAWIKTNGNGKRDATTLFETRNNVSDQSFEKTFRLPLPNAKVAEPFTLALSNVMRDRPTTISRLEIRGRLAPIFGMGMADKEGSVFVHNILPKGLAEIAGFQVGDVISAINGTSPKTTQEAVDMLSRVSIGDEVVFAIKRADQTKELRFVAE